MKYPNVQIYDDYRRFLDDLYKMNRKNSGVGSFRYLAKKFDWPVSYLSDVLKNRKNLSVQRAIQLGRFLEMDSVDLERLLFLIWQDSESEVVRSFFREQLGIFKNPINYMQEMQKEAVLKPEFPDKYKIIDEEVFSDIALLAIYELVVLRQGKINLQEISDLLFSFEELRSLSVLEQKIEKLQEKEFFKVKRLDNQIVGFELIGIKHLFFKITRENSHHMKQFAKNVQNILSTDKARGWLSSGFITIPKEKIIEVQKRLFELRSWLYNISEDSSSKEMSSRSDELLFQFDLNFLLVLDKNIIGIDDLNEWASKKS